MSLKCLCPRLFCSRLLCLALSQAATTPQTPTTTKAHTATHTARLHEDKKLEEELHEHCHHSLRPTYHAEACQDYAASKYRYQKDKHRITHQKVKLLPFRFTPVHTARRKSVAPNCLEKQEPEPRHESDPEPETNPEPTSEPEPKSEEPEPEDVKEPRDPDTIELQEYELPMYKLPEDGASRDSADAAYISNQDPCLQPVD